MSKPSLCRGYTASPHFDLNPRYLNEDPHGTHRCSVCGEMAYDELVDPHALDLECCDKQECIAERIRAMKNRIQQLGIYEACVIRMAFILAEDEVDMEALSTEVAKIRLTGVLEETR